MIRLVHLNVRHPAAAVAVAIAALAIGGVLFAFGLVLLLGLVVAGSVVGTAIVLYRKLTGRLPGFPGGARRERVTLDPSLEVFPDPQGARGELPPPGHG